MPRAITLPAMLDPLPRAFARRSRTALAFASRFGADPMAVPQKPRETAKDGPERAEQAPRSERLARAEDACGRNRRADRDVMPLDLPLRLVLRLFRRLLRRHRRHRPTY